MKGKCVAYYLALSIILMFIYSAPAHAEDEDSADVEELEFVDIEDVTSEWWLDTQAYPTLDRAINVMTARTIRKNSLEMIIDHRLRESFLDAPFQDFLGFDGGSLKVGLGLRYGIFNNLDAGMYRLNGTAEIFDVYEFDAKYQFLKQGRFPLDMAVRGGITWFSQKDVEDAHGFFGQLLTNRLFIHRINIGSGLLYHSQSSNSNKSNLDKEYSMAIPAYLEIRINQRVLWNIEVVENIAGYGSSRPVFSTAFKFITYRHTFALMVTNTQYISADGIVTNTPFGFDDLTIGFYITREIRL